MFRHLGSKVTILERGAQLLKREDEDISRCLEEILRNEGIEIRLDCSIERIENDAEGSTVVATVNGETLRLVGSHLLLATGRAPNTEDLNLASAGVDIDSHGFIRVNERLETTAPGIWALGDVWLRNAVRRSWRNAGHSADDDACGLTVHGFARRHSGASYDGGGVRKLVRRPLNLLITVGQRANLFG
jgi:pyruvate/2-oxoglutarate dehydrogenase complex dihydrolipoamide dehydrogenase (E3) component